MKFFVLVVLISFVQGALGMEHGEGLKCTNFSGYWKGICKSNLGTSDKSFLAIEQGKDCRSFHYGSHPVDFGVDNTIIWDAGQTTRIENYDWNDPVKMEYLTGSVSLVSNVRPNLEAKLIITKPRWWKMTLKLEGQVELEKGQLHPLVETCTYRKVGYIRSDE